MKNRLKRLLKPHYLYIINTYNLILNFVQDLKLYKKYSLTFSNTDLENKESDLILNYHSLEKGMLFKEMKKGFAEYRIKNLHVILNDPDIIKNINRSQIRVGYQVMCQYYELHQKVNYNIEDLYSKEQYLKYREILDSKYDLTFNGIIDWNKEDFYKETSADFLKFAYSRKSVREFTGNLISHKVINQVIELANTAPSVCNRQASSVYLVENKNKIDQLLNIQGGFTGYTKDVHQLLILTNDRKYYYTVGERNQFYIDGGIYLMNLLYALHYYQIGNCPANWGKEITDDKKVSKVIKISGSEKIICMIPIGELKESFRTTLSERRPNIENFKIIE